jgi:hypothetical protein
VNSKHLLKLTTTTMPFGKYKGAPLTALPQGYLLWLSRKGFPKGELGELLELMLEIDHNGLKHLLIPLKNGTYSA